MVTTALSGLVEMRPGMDIVIGLVIGFALIWWVVQFTGEYVAGRRVDDPFSQHDADDPNAG